VVALPLEPGGDPFLFGRQDRFLPGIAAGRKLIF
jgi:hypothetical protein